MSYSTHREPGPYPFVIRMDEELHDAVKARAALEERSMAQLIRWALRCYLAGSGRTPETPQ